MDEGLLDTEVVNYAIDFNSLRKAVMSCAHTIWQGMMPRPLQLCKLQQRFADQTFPI